MSGTSSLNQKISKKFQIYQRECKRKSYRRQSNNFNFRKILTQNTDEFCRNTTLHGLKYVADRELHPIERIFFALSLMIVMLTTCYFIFRVYSKWVTTPVIFGINPKPTLITNIPFPAVTICNSNQALKSKASKFSNNSIEYAMLELLCRRPPDPTVANSISDWSGLRRLIINISQPCSNMLVACHFGGIYYDCNEIFTPIITDEGLCCVFNMLHEKYMYKYQFQQEFHNSSSCFNPVDWYAEKGYPTELPKNFHPFKIPGTGESLGLSVVLNVQRDEYYCSSTYCVGFKMALHSPNESPNVQETGILIAPGYETKVRIRPEQIETSKNLQNINKKYRYCLFHDEGKLKYFAHYTQRNCEIECIAAMMYKYCNCISFYMPKLLQNATTCSMYDILCVEEVRLRLDPTIESCLDDCLPSCYDLTYVCDSFETRLHKFEKNQLTHILDFTNRSLNIEDVAVVNMYLKEYLFRSNIQTEFIGVSDVLSSIGGIMGLFLGFSFISIAELFYYGVLRPLRKFLIYDTIKRNQFVFNTTRNNLRQHLEMPQGQQKRLNSKTLNNINKSLSRINVNNFQQYY